MSSRRFAQKPPPGLCTELSAEDGLDPRFEPKGPRGKVTNRKALQLCRQVEHALSMALEGDVLRDLSVQSVVPAPDSSRLLVTYVNHGNEPVAAVLAVLYGQHAKLRGAIAASIHRRKTPELAFQVVRG